MTSLLIRAVSLLVPQDRRADWLAEWKAELWHACSAGRGFAFSRGSLADALWMRRNYGGRWLASPAQCLLVLGILVLFAGAFGTFQPQESSPDLILVARDYLPRSGVAFYRPAVMRVGSVPLTVGIASRNFFRVIGVRHASSGVVFSSWAWRKHFASSVGAQVNVAGRMLPVGGVVQADLWWLPMPVDAWLFDDRIPSRAYVIARTSEGLPGTRLPRSWMPTHALMLGVALLLLPLATPISLGEYPAGAGARRWFFLALKIGLLIPITYWGTYAAAWVIAPTIHPQALLVGYVFAFRWALVDQKRRCPVCLRLLAQPTRIGEASRTVFEWHGTELVCLKGHGLLEVREVATSSYGCQRWVSLDRSWAGLF